MDTSLDSAQNKNQEEPCVKMMLQLQEKYDSLLVKYESLLKESTVHGELKIKYKNLVDKLLERIECPVCLEVPESGPISACPNGHIICSKCVGVNCPTCRSKMADGKSLLAVTVMENIELKCHNLGCDQEFPITEMKAHRNRCGYRLVTCPATNCEQKLAFCSLIDHLTVKCQDSYAKDANKVINLPPDGRIQQTFFADVYNCGKLDTFTWNKRYFFFTYKHHKDFGYWTFHVEMLGTEEECSLFGVQIAVHTAADKHTGGKFVTRCNGEPCHVEKVKDAKKMSGLMVPNDVMKSKVVTKSETDGRMDFCVSIVLTRV